MEKVRKDRIGEGKRLLLLHNQGLWIICRLHIGHHRRITAAAHAAAAASSLLLLLLCELHAISTTATRRRATRKGGLSRAPSEGI